MLSIKVLVPTIVFSVVPMRAMMENEFAISVMTRSASSTSIDYPYFL